MFQESFNGVQEFEGFYEVSWLCPKHFKGISRAFQECFRGVSRNFHRDSKHLSFKAPSSNFMKISKIFIEVSRYFEEVSKLFKENFKGISTVIQR